MKFHNIVIILKLVGTIKNTLFLTQGISFSQQLSNDDSRGMRFTIQKNASKL
jgi:hypothetical protein